MPDKLQGRKSDMLRKREIAQIFSLSEATVQKLTHEIEDQIAAGRYSRHAVIRDGKLLLINSVVFMDYMANRAMLKEKNARKYVPAFDYQTSKQYMGLEETK